MKFSLTIGERFLLTQLLPQKGNILTMRDVKDLNGALLPSVKEEEEYGVVRGIDNITWDMEKATVEVEIDFTTPQLALVVNALRELEGKNELTQQHITLWDKFMEV